MADFTYPIDGKPPPGDMTAVADGVYWIRMPLPFALNHINLWLLDDGDGWTIVDSGLSSRKVQDKWETIFAERLKGKPVKRLIVTHYHPDHIGLAGWLCERLDIPLYMTQTDYLYCATLLGLGRGSSPEEGVEFYRRLGFKEKSLDAYREGGIASFTEAVGDLPMSFYRICDGDDIAIGGRNWRVVVVSGHTPEHACLYCEEAKILISGDQVLPRITTNVSVYPTEPEANPLKDWLGSLERLKAIPDDVLILPSHNEPFYGLHQRLDELIEHHRDRLAALRQACSEAPQTVVDLYPVLFDRRIRGIEHLFASGEAVSHLHYLMAKGEVERWMGEDGVYRYRTRDGGA